MTLSGGTLAAGTYTLGVAPAGTTTAVATFGVPLASGQKVFGVAAGAEVLRALIGRYLGDETSELARWLLSRVDREVAIEIIPARLTSWDYGERMRGIE